MDEVQDIADGLFHQWFKKTATSQSDQKMHDLKYVYIPEEHGVDGSEVGVLLTLDMHPDDFMVKDRAGLWNRPTRLYNETHRFDMAWASRTIYSLVEKGWLIVNKFDDDLRPTQVSRSDKPGLLRKDA